jgi:predicted nuclease of predicted toxin-antitoxin system
VSLFFDQNLSRRLPALLAAEFSGCDQAFVAGLAEADDRAVWAHATDRGLAVVSKERGKNNFRISLSPHPTLSQWERGLW